jgi:hypothetical protein
MQGLRTDRHPECTLQTPVAAGPRTGEGGYLPSNALQAWGCIGEPQPCNVDAMMPYILLQGSKSTLKPG